ncbi:MAG: HPr kinase/phosphatase C-terminal domain-containing protein [Rhodospirillales bacterium]|nr:HPr kinase/phosphatase C-terminal domain-containing protein [Rhodospirillales bacterium]
MIRLRGTCVAVDGAGVLLRGPSGAGKSDLALRLMAAGGRLIADDYTCVTRDGDTLVATAPAALCGLLEVRGIGIIRIEAEPQALLVAVVDLVPRASVERLPAVAEEQVLGVPLPYFQLDAFDCSAVARVRIVVGIARNIIVRLT